jgi:predicted transcriptional regulator
MVDTLYLKTDGDLARHVAMKDLAKIGEHAGRTYEAVLRNINAAVRQGALSRKEAAKLRRTAARRYREVLQAKILCRLMAFRGRAGSLKKALFGLKREANYD